MRQVFGNLPTNFLFATIRGVRTLSSELEMAATATWNGKVIAATEGYESVEGNVYFPPGSLKMEFLKPSSTKTNCPWKGVASYYNVEVDGKTNRDAAWYYPEPKPAAANIKDHVAFWKQVDVKKGSASQ